MIRFAAALCCAVFLLSVGSPAFARPLHRVVPLQVDPMCGVLWPCEAASPRRIAKAIERISSSAAQIVSHPTGCPRRAFCGCGASVRVFGRSVRSLWLASAWFKFPRAAPSPGMVAVRRGHVFVLETHIGGNVWKVYDANSGRRQTRIHPRSIAGYAIVNPNGAT
jgi:hypothetical protein